MMRMQINKTVIYIIAVGILGLAPVLALAQQDLTGLHIMPNGDVMLGNGDVLDNAKALSDGTVELPTGEIVRPMMDMRSSDFHRVQQFQNHDRVCALGGMRLCPRLQSEQVLFHLPSP